MVLHKNYARVNCVDLTTRMSLNPNLKIRKEGVTSRTIALSSCASEALSRVHSHPLGSPLRAAGSHFPADRIFLIRAPAQSQDSLCRTPLSEEKPPSLKQPAATSAGPPLNRNRPTMAKKAKAARRARRSPEEMIADLEAKIREVKNRAQAKELKQSPSVKEAMKVVRGVDKALEVAAEADMMTGAVEEDGEEGAVDIREDLNLLNLQNAMSPSTTTVSVYLINQKKW